MNEQMALAEIRRMIELNAPPTIAAHPDTHPGLIEKLALEFGVKVVRNRYLPHGRAYVFRNVRIPYAQEPGHPQE